MRLVKCSRKEAAHNSIRLCYGSVLRKCLVMRASNSLEHEKWLVGIIQAMAAAEKPRKYMPVSATLSDPNANTATNLTRTRIWRKPNVCLAQHERKHHPIAANTLVTYLDKDGVPSVNIRSQAFSDGILRSTCFTGTTKYICRLHQQQTREEHLRLSRISSSRLAMQVQPIYFADPQSSEWSDRSTLNEH